MNIIFVLYQSLACNSASHVDGLARELSLLGHDCLVALPEHLDDADRFAPMPYRIATYRQILSQSLSFADGRGPDVVHTWTPREIVRKFRDQLAASHRFRTVIHLEDNEEHIARVALGETGWRVACADRLPIAYPDHLTDPVQAPGFFAQASGVTLLIDRLAECMPLERPSRVFWPSVDRTVFYPRPRNDAMRAMHGIAPHEIVLCYHGNMHQANRVEIRSLYLAVALLNRQGFPARLVRMGTDHVTHEPEYCRWAAEHSIDLGYVVDRRRLVDVLAMADVFVQPGTADAFNDFRFPSKLPEFFALGRPVVLPRANIGLVIRHLEDAFVLDEANGQNICAAVKTICSDRKLYQKLSDAAWSFAEQRLSWRQSAATVASFYEALACDSAAA
ncbi:MAG: glycosyltransferase [Planctomycetia bacterium]|jgi:glycosyltransferase involved in cell wall biosynthesis|nr:glycosyltransferase [Planctomycetia bacterium]